MRLHDLFEARRNPAVNTDGRLNDPASSASGFLSHFRPITGDLPTYFVTFTELPKVGINPSSRYQTPIGIYAYPVIPEIMRAHSKRQLPFAGDAKYMSILQMAADESRVLWFDDDSSYPHYERDYSKLLAYLTKQYGSEEDSKKFLLSAQEDAYEPLDPQSRIWNMSRWVAAADALNPKGLEHTRNVLWSDETIFGLPIKWNVVLRKVLGYEAVVDLNGAILHDNEPIQAVFLSRQAMRLVDQRRNQNAADRHPQHLTMLEFYHAANNGEVSWPTFWKAIIHVHSDNAQHAVFKINRAAHYIDTPVGMEVDAMMQEVSEKYLTREEAGYFQTAIRALFELPRFAVTKVTRDMILDQLIFTIVEYTPTASKDTFQHLAKVLADTLTHYPFSQEEVQASLQRHGANPLSDLI